MKDGRVLEIGDHDSLLAKGGAYKTLVDAQAFIETEDSEDVLPSDAALGELKKQDDENAGNIMRRTATSKSVASSAYAEKVEKKHKRRSLGTLFRRMATINSDQKATYSLGFLAAVVTGMMCVHFAASEAHLS